MADDQKIILRRIKLTVGIITSLFEYKHSVKNVSF
jgi:hypothetical protein